MEYGISSGIEKKNVAKGIEELEILLIGKIKRVFERDSDSYAAFTDIFRFRGDFYNYIVLNYNEKSSRYAIELGMWYDNMKEYVSKRKSNRLTEEKLADILLEIQESF